jgi:hypothetical protein
LVMMVVNAPAGIVTEFEFGFDFDGMDGEAT